MYHFIRLVKASLIFNKFKMAVFSKKSKKGSKDDKLIGAYIPKELYSYFVLQSIAADCSVSTILQTLLEKAQKETPIENIIPTLREKIESSYLQATANVTSTQEKLALIKKIKEEAAAELETRGILPTLIKEIIK